MRSDTKKSLVLAVFCILIVVSLVFVSAGVYVSPPDSVYNLGDSVDLDVSIDPIEDGPLTITLTCDGTSRNIFTGPPIENLVIPLNSKWIGSMKGDCYFSTEYSGETKKVDPGFKISNQLNVKLTVDSLFSKPSEEISVSGSALKVNGEGINGEVEMTLPFSTASVIESDSSNNQTNNETNNTQVEQIQVNSENKFYGNIRNGEFSANFRLPENIAAGDYKIDVYAYEKSSSGEKTNEGRAFLNLKISQILKSIDVAVNGQNFDPGTNVSIKASLLDQTNVQINDQISIIITDDEGYTDFQKVINSGETAIYDIPTNQTSGYYTIKVSSSDKDVVKTLFINEKQIIFFELRNETLFVKNIGNMKYNKDVQVDLNGKPFVKRVELEIGESKEFILSGKNQEYDVKASDGDTQIEQSGVLLTGSAVDVRDSGDRNSVLSFFYAPVVWIFLIIILGAGVLFLMKNILKKKSVAKPFDIFERKKTLNLDSVIKTKKDKIEEEKNKGQVVVKKKVSLMDSVPPTQAEQGLVTTGHKNNATIISIRIKNKITPFLKDEIEKAVEPVYLKKAVVCEHGANVLIILSPMITKTFKNEVEATRIAEQISDKLKEANLKFKEKIEFGIGINSGDIINEIRNKKLVFTALGNSVLHAKKLSEISNGEVLISKEAYEKGISEIKAERKTVGDMVVYEVKKVVDYEKNKKFIDDFMKKMERDKPGFTRNTGGVNRNNPNNSESKDYDISIR